MEFQHPSFLILLVIIPTLVIWYLRSGKDNEGTIVYSKYFFINYNIFQNTYLKGVIFN